MTEWMHRHLIIVSASDRDAANAVAVEVTGNPADALTFGVPLSTTGQEPATHYGCSTAATDDIRVALAVKLGQGRVPSVKFWRINAATDLLVQTNVAASQSRIGQPMTWQDALQDVGLQTVQGEDE